tara:strand:+ start:283 stop:474 length:192 start_codon:yes stop_codon:yes gene_type:complete
MPTKHIDDITWRKVEKELVKAVVSTQTSIKDVDILRILINVGIKNIDKSDYKELVKRKGKLES